MPKNYGGGLSVEQRNKKARLDALRESLKGGEYLRQIEEVCKELGHNWRELSSEQIAALRLKADINFRRLNKVLPDLKQVEVRQETEEQPKIDLSSLSENEVLELQRLLRKAEGMPPPIEGEKE